ncbi:MAG: hypothetical protein M9894_31690 [Planctomycetes bacterium]|nr:hypothetical protein [Planctomycetota bacterium]
MAPSGATVDDHAARVGPYELLQPIGRGGTSRSSWAWASSPGPAPSTRASAPWALAAALGRREEARQRAQALRDDPEVDARLLRNESGWVRDLVTEHLGDRAFARELARALGAE